MKIQHTTNGNVTIHLSGDEIATAIDAYLVSQRVYVSGPRTITANGTILKDVKGEVFVNGTVIFDGERIGQAHHNHYTYILPAAAAAGSVPAGELNPWLPSWITGWRKVRFERPVVPFPDSKGDHNPQPPGPS